MGAVRRLYVVNEHGAAGRRAPAPGVLRVALATSDMKWLDAHFGTAPKFALYDITEKGWSFVEALAFDSARRRDGDDGIAAKVAALAGCHLLFCLAIGGPAAAKALAARLRPVKTPIAAPIAEVLENTRATLARGAPPWLCEAASNPAQAREFSSERG